MARRQSKPPIHPNERLAAPVTKELQAALNENIFDPLLEVLTGEPKMTNAKRLPRKRKPKSLEAGLQRGTVKYIEGRFTGEINAYMVRELKEMGAQKVGSAYFVNKARLPYELMMQIERLSKVRAITYQSLAKVLADAGKKAVDAIKVKTFLEYGQKLQDFIAKKISKQVPGISIPDTKENLLAKQALIESAEYPIREKYDENLKKYTSSFALEKTTELRELLRKSFEAGGSRKDFLDIVREQLGVSERRAKFISQQELRLITQTSKAANYLGNGIKYYKWDATLDGKLRPAHRELHGKIFAYDEEPPIVAVTKSGVRRAHAGCDFNCRCVDKPLSVFEAKKWEAQRLKDRKKIDDFWEEK